MAFDNMAAIIGEEVIFDNGLDHIIAEFMVRKGFCLPQNWTHQQWIQFECGRHGRSAPLLMMTRIAASANVNGGWHFWVISSILDVNLVFEAYVDGLFQCCLDCPTSIFALHCLFQCTRRFAQITDEANVDFRWESMDDWQKNMIAWKLSVLTLYLT